MNAGEWLSDQDIRRHAMVVRQMLDAQAVMRMWSQMLTIDYGLTPEDTVTDDGRIMRAVPAEPSQGA